MKAILKLSLSLVLLCKLEVYASPESGNEAFDFYFGEFIGNHLSTGHGMKRIIEEGLAASVFSSNSEREFMRFLEILDQAVRQYPEHYDSFRRVDRLMAAEFQRRVNYAKEKRLIYSAAGAVIGAAVALPVGGLLQGSLGKKALWIAVPTGVLAGGGAGFLLAHLRHMPKYHYERGQLTDDIDFFWESIEGGQ